MNQDQSNASYTALIHQFAEDGNADLFLHYPNYYAGAYINDQGYLVVLTKNATNTDIEYLKEICSNENILFEEAEYSYNELISVKESIKNSANNMRASNSIGNYSLEIRDNENKVYVGLADVTDTSIQQALVSGAQRSTTLSSVDCVEFYQNGELELCSTTLTPGSYIHSTLSGSVGFKASYTSGGETKVGFITAGHVTLGSSYVYDNKWHITGQIGRVIVNTISGSSDAAFVEVNDNFVVSNTVDGCTVQAGLMYLPAIGSLVYKSGVNGIEEGHTITHTYEGYFGGTYLTFMIKTDVYCEDGDSGGLLYTKSGSTARVVGICTAGDWDKETDEFICSYFSNASLLPWDISVIN